MVNMLAVCFLALILTLQSIHPEKIGGELFRYVQGIEGQSQSGRGDFIKAELKKMNVDFTTVPFDTSWSKGGRHIRAVGENIIVRMGKGNKHVVIGAHSDAVKNSPGANDNGGGVAVVLGLIKAFKGYSWNVTVNFCFFDREEDGLIGSSVYVRESPDNRRHLAMINLDVVGTGEEVYVGPVGGGDDDLLMPFARTAAAQRGFPFREGAVYPLSDHLSFANAGLENISISVVPKGDAEKIIGLLSGEKRTATNFPKVLEVMHTDRDSSTYVTPEALTIAYEFTKTVLMLVNESKR